MKLNTEDNPEVPSRYGISAIPTFLLFKKGIDQPVAQVRGQMPYEKLKAAVEPHLS